MRIAVFIDAANMSYAQKPEHAGFSIDFDKFKTYLCQLDASSDCFSAIYYVGKKMPVRLKDQKFLEALRHMGYKIHNKPTRTYIDPDTGAESEKANLDIEIAVDMLMHMDKYDKAYLCSGDGDFTRVIQYLIDHGKTVVVVTTWSMLSDDLYDACSEFIDLKDIRQHIERVLE